MVFRKRQLVVSIAFALSGISAASAQEALSAPARRAQTHLQNFSSYVQASDGDQFIARGTIVDADGSEHVRFDRTYKGLRVIGGDVVVHSNARGQAMRFSHTMTTRHQLDTHPTLDDTAAIASAESAFRGQRDAASRAEQVIYARGARPALAYEVITTGTAPDGTPSVMHTFIDAHGGHVLDKWDEIETAATAGTGKSLFDGAVPLTTDSQTTGGYALRDPSRGNHYTTNMKNRTSGGTTFTDADNVWGSGTTADTATAAVDATYGQNMTWDYYKNVHGRNGIANDGRGAYSRVHYSRNYVNAFWSDSCFCMTYGDGDGTSYYPLVSLDVAGHEMTHGVTSRTANLTYSGESGGLNEATSDIFGTLVEFYAGNASDPGDYLIGEKIFVSNKGVANPTKALRYMFKPSLDGSSPDCYTSTIGSLDVHYSSGVANHVFYLMAEGAVVPTGFNLTPSQLVCNGDTALTALGRDVAGKIWYRALTVYMTSNTNYKGARTATLNAAADLYGTSSAQYAAVGRAWSAVSVN
ncbi:M4 family metallopeptidase [Niveibacterium umoris]|uniref:Neutral metalloproteinase n=1 Tax=Niveibacterium umoris TaxID=1193620 RepID=A0A840BNH4_9RHOO|nr:M4 family metallopeptidase [Niveibacterium umoris]MBB4013049.1 Zn-dependent metalloprotease [Niveibacterium umoris]